MPPIETFTNSTPSAPYFSVSGMPGRNTCGASISAASPFSRRSRTNPATDRTAGSTSLAASDSTRLTPNPSRSR